MPVITMRRRISGKRNGLDWPVPGKTIEVSGDEAQTLARLGLATVDEANAPEAETENQAEVESEEEPDGLEDMKLTELREVAADRDLSTAGTKTELVARLRGE